MSPRKNTRLHRIPKPPITCELHGKPRRSQVAPWANSRYPLWKIMIWLLDNWKGRIMSEALHLSENCQPFHSWEWLRRYLLCWQTRREKYAAIKGVREPRYIAGVATVPLGIGSPLAFSRVGYPTRANEVWALNVGEGWERTWIFNRKNYKPLPCRQVYGYYLRSS